MYRTTKRESNTWQFPSKFKKNKLFALEIQKLLMNYPLNQGLLIGNHDVKRKK